MKKLLKLILLLSFSLVLQNEFWHNLVFQNRIGTVILVATVLSLFELIIKPILKILLLPINILTLGLFKIVITSLGLYLALFLLSDFKILPIHTSPQYILGIAIPAINVIGFWAVVINSLSNYFLLGFFRLIIKPKKEHK